MADIGIYGTNSISGASAANKGMSSIAVENGNDRKVMEALSKVSSGSTIEGKVTSISVDEKGVRIATIDIGNNTFISAKLNSNTSLIEGQSVTFRVNISSNGTVNLNPLYQNTAVNNNILKAIAEAGMKADAQTLSMVKDMMSQGMRIDSESLLNMNHAIIHNPGVKTSTLMNMQSLGIPLTSANINQFENYQNFQHRISSSISDIMTGLSNAYISALQAGNTSQAMDMYAAMIKMFVNPQQPLTELLYLSVTAPDKAAGVLNGFTEEAGEFFGNNAQNMQSAEGQEKGFDLPDRSSGDVRSGIEDGEIIKLTAEENEAPSASNVLSEKNLSFADITRRLGISGDLSGMKDDDILSLLSVRYDSTAHVSHHTDQLWAKLFNSKEFSELMNRSLESRWLLNPADAAEKENIERLYSRLGDQSNKLSAIFENMLGKENPLSQSASNLASNLDFMNQLNQLFQYVQLPLKMQNGSASGDLYVYTNKKKLTESDGTVSAVLHLDMMFLGPTDVYVKLKDQLVSTNFYLADDAAIDLMAEHIEELTKALEARGFKMSANILLQTDKSSEDAAVEEMLKVNPSAVSVISQTSFDARA